MLEESEFERKGSVSNVKCVWIFVVDLGRLVLSLFESNLLEHLKRQSIRVFRGEADFCLISFLKDNSPLEDEFGDING